MYRIDVCRKTTIIVIVKFFFFKQKTAYEMRISDWSSDVCSSDLAEADEAGPLFAFQGEADPHAADRDRRRRRGAGHAVAGLDLTRRITRRAGLVVARLELDGPRLTDRQDQIADRVANVLERKSTRLYSSQ